MEAILYHPEIQLTSGTSLSNAVVFKQVFTVIMKFEATQGKPDLTKDLEK
jgi:cell division FtsZ-interacting protein ZapD